MTKGETQKLEELRKRIDSVDSKVDDFSGKFFDWSLEISAFMNEQRLHNQKVASVIYNDDEVGTKGAMYRIAKNEKDIVSLRNDFETQKKIVTAKKGVIYFFLTSLWALILFLINTFGDKIKSFFS